MSKKILLILKCLCMNIEMRAIRQLANAGKLVNLWFCTENHPIMEKICIFGPKTSIFSHRDLER